MTEKSPLSEDEAYAIALNDHPEWRQQLEDGTLPDEIMGEDGEPMSPRMHITIHSIVERSPALGVCVFSIAVVIWRSLETLLVDAVSCVSLLLKPRKTPRSFEFVQFSLNKSSLDQGLDSLRASRTIACQTVWSCGTSYELSGGNGAGGKSIRKHTAYC